MVKMSKEPLVHFLGAAALLFAANAVFSGDDREMITVDAATQEYLIKQEQDLRLRPLTEEEKREVVDGFIEEEILVREAKKRGLDNSSRIRQLLIQNMRFFVASDLPQPTEKDLEAWFESNLDRYQSPPAVTYDHVLFADPDNVPANILERLRAGKDHAEIGDTDFLNRRLPMMSQRMVAASFGPVEAPKILAINDEAWHGPFHSAKGVHFLRVAEQHKPLRPTYDESKRWLEQRLDNEQTKGTYES